jgi:SAM-dependent methyltransferase
VTEPAAVAQPPARTAAIWAALDPVVTDGTPLQVLDVGGGSGMFAVPLAQLGHRVTVVDPSPDSLAALERRAAETGTAANIRAVQGDAAGLAEVLPAARFDAVLCHSVLEVVDDPAEALAAVTGVLRPGGVVSVLAANRSAAVLARVSAGRLAEARRLLTDPAGVSGDGDPLLRRFSLAELRQLLAAAGLHVRDVHAIRVFADLAPPPLLDGDPDAAADLLALERAAAERADYLPVATQLHLLAEREDPGVVAGQG